MRNSGKMNTFLGIFAGVNEYSFVQNSCLLQLDLAILWPRVAKNYGVPKIHVFLGRILAFLWPKVVKNHGISEICVFLGRILVFLWPKVVKNYGVSEIHVFLHPDMLEFCSLGELSCRGCELEIECQIAYPSVTGKVQNLRACVVHTLSESECFACWGRAESALLLSFYVRS